MKKILVSILAFIAIAATANAQQTWFDPNGRPQNGKVDLLGNLLVSQANGSAPTDFTATGAITTQNLNPNSGVATVGSTVAISSMNGVDNVSVQVTGVYTGALTAQITIDGVNWIAASLILNYNTGAQTSTIVSAATGVFQFGAESATGVRITALAAQTGTATVTLRANTVASPQAIDAPLPAGTNTIGGVILPDTAITGQGSQTALNNNIILAAAGAGAQSATGFRSWSIQINTAAGTFTAGAITFEGSNDNINFVAFNVYDQSTVTGVPLSTYTVVANTPRWFAGPLQWGFVRARLSTGITGTTTGVQGFAQFSTASFAMPFVAAYNPATSSNLLVQFATGAASSLPGAAVGNGSQANVGMTGDRQLIVHEDGDPSNEFQYTTSTTPITTTASTPIQAAQGAGIRNYLKSFSYQNTSATASLIEILDGASVIWIGNAPATMALPANITFLTPLKGTAATALNVVLVTTATNTYVNGSGFHNN